MKKDIILAGVGGQGILSIATVIGEAATAAGVRLKQAEVHGMSQRGGDVQSNLRLSDTEIFSDLIPKGKADLIISMEPMEALRYLPYLDENGVVVTSTTALININDYPDIEKIKGELKKLPRLVCAECSSNMEILGMAAKYIEILTPAQLKDAMCRIFSTKGADVVKKNCEFFDKGLEFGK